MLIYCFEIASYWINRLCLFWGLSKLISIDSKESLKYGSTIF
jgi:hypothetical protein